MFIHFVGLLNWLCGCGFSGRERVFIIMKYHTYVFVVPRLIACNCIDSQIVVINLPSRSQFFHNCQLAHFLLLCGLIFF